MAKKKKMPSPPWRATQRVSLDFGALGGVDFGVVEQCTNKMVYLKFNYQRRVALALDSSTARNLRAA